jgi:hypothetical protein
MKKKMTAEQQATLDAQTAARKGDFDAFMDAALAALSGPTCRAEINKARARKLKRLPRR